MATAKKTEQVVKTVEVTLILSEDEARTLLAVGSRVGGCPSQSPRRHIDSVNGALRSALGVRGTSDTAEHRLIVRGDSIHFKDYGTNTTTITTHIYV
jgi:hypothetical protein